MEGFWGLGVLRVLELWGCWVFFRVEGFFGFGFWGFGVLGFCLLGVWGLGVLVFCLLGFAAFLGLGFWGVKRAQRLKAVGFLTFRVLRFGNV